MRGLRGIITKAQSPRLESDIMIKQEADSGGVPRGPPDLRWEQRRCPALWLSSLVSIPGPYAHTSKRKDNYFVTGKQNRVR